MTADELEGITLRHADAERWLPSRLRSDPSALAGSSLLAHEERGALLAFVRRVAEWPAEYHSSEDERGCWICGASYSTLAQSAKTPIPPRTASGVLPRE